MKNQLNNFLYFMKGERRAVVAVGCIVVFAIGVLMVIPSPQPSPYEGEGDHAACSHRQTSRRDSSPSQGELERVSVSFDPNTVDSLTLISFGLKPWKVKNFLHYRRAGKVFRSAEDLGDTYGWTEEDVEMLRAYVVVSEKYEKHGRRWEKQERWERKEGVPEHTSNKFQSLTKVDISTADTALLRRIPGVGEKISLAIVRYRQRLGGFHSVNQLLEISIVSPELLEWMEVSPSPNIQRININKASFQALNSHPYISYEQTKALLQYIRLYGEVEDEKSLLSTGIFSSEELEKLRPYITYE